jgi:hypothetical protein
MVIEAIKQPNPSPMNSRPNSCLTSGGSPLCLLHGGGR